MRTKFVNQLTLGPKGALSKGKGKSKMTVSPLHLVEKDTMDKEKALEAALGQIERSFGKGSIMK